MPSEFGNDVDRMEIDFKAVQGVYGVKRNLRREIEKSGIPYTFVISSGFAGYFVATLAQDNVRAPPRDKVFIWGDGNAKAVLNEEDDIATFTIKSIADPRAENNIRPKENILSQNDVVALWEKKTGLTLEKKELAEIIEETPPVSNLTPFPGDVLHAIRYAL